MKRPCHLVTAIVLLCICVLAMFGDVLFSNGDMVLSHSQTDLSQQFLSWREFGFEQLRQGNLALWNPYVFAGTPYLGGFQSALLYPLNFLHLLLPPAKAINVAVAFHALLLGIFMYLWVSYRGLSWFSAFVASFLIMFSGAYFLHIFAGHLPHLCAMTWAPLIFLTIDGLVRDRSFGWVFLGMFAVSMQILAGFPQHVFYTGVAGILYLSLRLIKAEGRTGAILGFVGIYLGALILTAAQVLTGLQAASEGVRSVGVSYDFAAVCSFPPENVLTLLVPGIFGNDVAFPYWGRCYSWETSLFIGLTGVVLAVCGLLYGRRDIRCVASTMILLLGLLALGAHTPVFRILYEWIPGFNVFRGSGKFNFYVSLFLAFLCAAGFDALTHSSKARRRIITSTLLVGIPLMLLALFVKYSPDSWERFVRGVGATGESYLPAQFFHDDHSIALAGSFALRNVLTSCLFCLLFLLAAIVVRNARNVGMFFAAAALVQVFVFARSSRPVFDASSVVPSEMRAFAARQQDKACRILYPDSPNIGLSLGLSNLCGYDHMVLRRYAEFVAFSQNLDPDEVGQYLRFPQPQHPFLGMLRCKYQFGGGQDSRPDVRSESDLLPRVFLVWNYSVAHGRDGIFAKLQDLAFSPRETVVLERPIALPVVPGGEGSSRVVGSSTDVVDIEASVSSPAILVITDNYSSGWRAYSRLQDKQKYEIFSADYVFMAIPLPSGHHRIRLEYLPTAFVVGKWVSVISVFVYVCAAVLYFMSRVIRARRT